MNTEDLAKHYQKHIGEIRFNNRKVFQVESIKANDDKIYVFLKELLLGKPLTEDNYRAVEWDAYLNDYTNK